MFGQIRCMSFIKYSYTFLEPLGRLTRWNLCAMASTNAKRNRLAFEKSPYLQQHASNPVDWYPWGQEAFEKAKKEKKLIFLSVGYSTCHWCHVMERESFENKEIGKMLNDNFVSIKVDREERPDVDKVYMTFVQATQGSGGWPMSVWLTPDLKPIVGGTYFPPDDRYYGQPGFKTVLERIATKWTEAADQMSNQGAKIMDALVKGTVIKAVAGEDYIPSMHDVQMGFIQLAKSYDSNLGGFGNAPKFPQPVNFSVLWRTHHNGPETEDGRHALEMATFTLKQMAKGGMYDHVAEGFHRYSTDARWHVPHFEKMLYDQAQLATAYLQAYQITKDEKFADVARKIFLYVNRDMSNKNGGFYSAEDADSLPTSESTEKKEGAFCVWTMQEVRKILADPLPGKSVAKVSDLFAVYYDVKEEGNVDPFQDPHDELKQQNVLMVHEGLSKTADRFGLTTEEAAEILTIAREKLFNVRQHRPKPHLDTKMLTAWNSLMLSSYALGGQILNDATLQQRAVKAAEFIRAHLYDVTTGTLLRSVYTANDQGLSQIEEPIGGFVEDYAFLIRGLIDLYETTFDDQWLEWALKLQETQDNLFWDTEDGGYFSSVANDPSILIRMKDDQDNAEPSANSVSATNLLRLAEFCDLPDLEKRSRSLLNTFGERLRKVPVSLPEMLSAVYFLAKSSQQIVIVGDSKQQDTQKLIQEVHSHFLPNKILIVTNGNSDGFLCNKNKLLATMKQVDGKATCYVCKNRTCSLPVMSSESLSDLLKEF